MRNGWVAVVLLALSQEAAAAEGYFQVQGMKTEACARNVEAVLKATGQVTATEVNRELGLVWAEYTGLTDKVLAERLSAGDGKHPPHPTSTIAAAKAKALIAQAPRKEPKAPASSPKTGGPLNPWDPIDETFRGCEGGCGLRGEDPRARVQPGAVEGQRVYCPVSGVVFQVSATSPKAEVDGKTLYFCCEGCARHFAVAREEVLPKRGLALGAGK